MDSGNKNDHVLFFDSAGDVALVPDLIEFLLEQTESFLDRYAEDKEFKVPTADPVGENIDENEDE